RTCCPSPCPPLFALTMRPHNSLVRLSTCRSPSSITSPPRPPTPPSGPPFGTNFSRRKLTHPRPPFPARTKTLIRSTNIQGLKLPLAPPHVTTRVGHSLPVFNVS